MKKTLFLLLLVLGINHFSYTQNIFEMNNAADMMLLERNYYAAIGKYKTILEINPNFLNAIRGLAQAFFHLGEYQEANRQISAALRLDRNNIEIMSLQASILLALGDIHEAERIFRYINSREPNNINAYFGFAEIALFSGRYSQAAVNYLNVLSLSPTDRRALLSLVLILAHQGQHREAERYLAEALRLYADDYFTLYIAARYYLESGNLARSERWIRESLALRPDNLDSALLYVKLLLFSGRYDQIHSVMAPFGRSRNNSIISYVLGKASERKGDYNTAIRHYAEAIRINPDDEISRYSLENIIRAQREFTDPIRARHAEYHFERGRWFFERHYIRRARQSFRRGLLIDPYSARGRLQYANIYLQSGYWAKYLSQLQILPSQERQRQNISDLIEVYERMTQNNVASRWRIDQFLIDKNHYTFDIYFIESLNMLRPAGEEVIASVLSSILTHSDIIRVNRILRTTGFAEAFSLSRNSPNPSDYFIILRVVETQRTFSTIASLHSTHTGALINEYRVNTTGNRRIWENLNRLAERIIDDSAQSGRILRINFDRGIINLGRLDGIRENDTFFIVKSDRVTPSRSSIGSVYSQADIIGQFQVTRVDENISEGIIRSRDVFSLINHGDFVFPETQNVPPRTREDVIVPERGLFNMIMNIRKR
ncbi:MAG: tetratricopeptide repeat protein [Spirochaetes bacterium]|nr:tetratricopeptide repeat protein [Spirochaetota bacterium]